MRSTSYTTTMNTVVLALVVAISSSSSAQQTKKPVDVSGTWRYEYELEGQTRKDSLQLNLNKDGTVTGIYNGVSEKPIDLTSGKVEDNEVWLELNVDYQGSPVKVKFNGKIKADDIVGSITAVTPDGEYPFDWVAKRSVEPADVVGQWELEIDAGERVIEPKLQLSLDGKELKGKYIDSTGNVDVQIEKARIEKNTLKFTINVKMDVGNIKADFSGRPYGNKISGTVDYTLNGEPGSLEFSGSRKAAKNTAAPK